MNIATSNVLGGRAVDASAPTDQHVLTWVASTSRWTPQAIATGVTDHGALTGLADDDHTQYALLAGRGTAPAGGQVLAGRFVVGGASLQKAAQFNVVGQAAATATGTTSTNAATTITGVGTAFLTEIAIGDRIALSSAPSTFGVVTAIASDTSLTVRSALGNGTSQTIAVNRAIARFDRSTGAQALTLDDLGTVLPGGDVNLPNNGVVGGYLTSFVRASFASVDASANIHLASGPLGNLNGITIGGTTGQGIYVRVATSYVAIGVGTLAALPAKLSVYASAAADPIFLTQGMTAQAGAHWQMRGQSSTTAGQDMAIVDPYWQTQTHASRKAGLKEFYADSGSGTYPTGWKEGRRGWSDGTNARHASAAAPSAPTDADIGTSQISFYLDEVGNSLKVRVRYSNGTTLKTGTIALV